MEVFSGSVVRDISYYQFSRTEFVYAVDGGNI
jgi:hypothetical protein